jgi:hypothetical protein
VTSDEIGRESSAKVTRSAGGLTPASLCVVPTGLAEILAPYPGLTPWANFMPPRERGFTGHLRRWSSHMPTLPQVPRLPHLPKLPQVPSCLNVPKLPHMPTFPRACDHAA